MNKPKKPDGRKNNGGPRANAGNKSRAERGLPPVKKILIEAPVQVKILARKNHGTLPKALAFAAKYGPDDVIKIEN